MHSMPAAGGDHNLWAVFALICLGGIFVMAEFALVSVRRTRLEAYARKGDPFAMSALRLIDKPDGYLAVVQIGITLVTMLIGMMGGEDLTPFIQNFVNQYAPAEYAEWVATFSSVTAVILVTYVTLVLGELIPKRIGMIYSEQISRWSAFPMEWITRLMMPVVFSLSISANLFYKIFRLRTTEDQSVTEEEIKAMVETGAASGSIEEIEQDIVENVFHLGDRTVASLMTVRQKIVWLDQLESPENIRKTILKNRHSIYPLCAGDLDRPLGFVQVKDLLDESCTLQTTGLRNRTKKCHFVPEKLGAWQTLDQFKKLRIHQALVVDEYGHVKGMVTLNDIMDALVGEVGPEGTDDYTIIKREDGSLLIDAQLPFEDFVRAYHLNQFRKEANGKFNTIGGFVLNYLKRIPKCGEKFEYENWGFEVVDMDRNRIDKLLVTPPVNGVME
jgi:putative hemolysin